MYSMFSSSDCTETETCTQRMKAFVLAVLNTILLNFSSTQENMCILSVRFWLVWNLKKGKDSNKDGYLNILCIFFIQFSFHLL